MTTTAKLAYVHISCVVVLAVAMYFSSSTFSDPYTHGMDNIHKIGMPLHSSYQK